MRFSFLILFYLTTAIVLIISLLGLPFRYKNFRFFVIFFTKNMQWVMRIFNIKVKVINPDFANLKGCLFASKHLNKMCLQKNYRMQMEWMLTEHNNSYHILYSYQEASAG